VATQPRSESEIIPSAMKGRALRQMREEMGMSQKQLAQIVGITRSSLGHIEDRDSFVPTTVAVSVRAVQSARVMGVISNLARNPKTTQWRKSVVFAHEPPFNALPPNGTTCGCEDQKCRLTPVGNGEWTDRGRFWIFHGQRCGKRVYLDAGGQKVLPPRKEPMEVCSACGRRRELGSGDSKRLGEKIWDLRCRLRPSDPPSLQHDPPTYWRKRNGKLERLPHDAIEKMHGRSRRSFTVPKCELEGCELNGRTMERSAVLCPSTNDGGTCQIYTYRCRATKAHAEYRVLPRGEVATQLAAARYRWVDGETGRTVETVAKKRAVHHMRVMPSSSCPECGAALCQGAGPWKLKGGQRRWKARCNGCQKIYRVRNDGAITIYKDSRWRKAKRGLTAGTILGDTKARITVAASLQFMTPSEKASHLYPKQASKDHARHSTTVFLGRQRQKIKLEKRRLDGLTEFESKIEIENANRKLNSPN
jgi:DNA-binding XRE family transcriptional regulator